jgi:phosphopantothenoylcysteine decarboxylase/phosphopantothenate--cysteine ligase
MREKKMNTLRGKEIILGVTGGIAIYKSPELVRQLVKVGAKVQVVMTKNAQEFITPLTFQVLSGNPVITQMFHLLAESKIGHVALADRADVVVIAPATANILGKVASGIGDDMLSTLMMAARSPVLLAPAMNCRMWANPIVQRNVEFLREEGYHIIEPGFGELACGEEGKGRMAEVDEIIEEMEEVCTKKDLQGERILITAGPTQEPFDPIRFITNRSSGKMGYALANVAQKRGAEVILISGPTSLATPRKVKFIKVGTALEMREATLREFQGATVVIKAAAVADYHPAVKEERKLKKSDASIMVELEKNPDILEELWRNKGNRILIGFAAETERLIKNAQGKLKAKNLDLIVANDVSQEGSGFSSDSNQVKIIDQEGRIEDLPLLPKEEVAEWILNRLKEMRKRTG